MVLWPKCISVNKEVHDDIPLPLDYLNLCINRYLGTSSSYLII
jgi:hypothetical protein